ncbi:regulatory protein RecX [Thiohalocapsa marina]|uniref:Regulatory protein RecX n=1 Tax=Thiohalocapsa marina TaxID=424902 RepID=A0A5M8FVT7_9GAMM|nr:regulatory protein RecX [Thiohalocapsa marina]KAA6187895.1 regulatory protein RecX [Thiohalocapsa marina]
MVDPPAPDEKSLFDSDALPGHDSLALEIRSRAIKLLTTREHSCLELQRKLEQRGYPPQAVRQVLDDLQRDDLLSEQRLAEAYVAERLGKGFGPVRIRFELREKGLSDAQIDPHLMLDDTQVLAVMARAHQRRFGPAARDDRATAAKRARFLEYRGFPSYLIARYLGDDG